MARWIYTIGCICTALVACDLILDRDEDYCPELWEDYVSIVTDDTTGYAGSVRTTGDYKRCEKYNDESTTVSRVVGDGARYLTASFVDGKDHLYVNVQRTGGNGPIIFRYFLSYTDTLRSGVAAYNKSFDLTKDIPSQF